MSNTYNVTYINDYGNLTVTVEAEDSDGALIAADEVVSDYWHESIPSKARWIDVDYAGVA